MIKNKSYILFKKEVKLGIKDHRSLFIIFLSTLIFYPGLIIGMTYLQFKDSESAELNIPRVVLQGGTEKELFTEYGELPFDIVMSNNPQGDLLDNKIEGILVMRKDNEDSINYEFKKKTQNLYIAARKLLCGSPP